MSNNKFKVLIVEDEANICSFIETLLTTNDYQALVAHTCTMGLTLFASHNPDLVILDLGLPDRDGLEFIRTVRQKYMTAMWPCADLRDPKQLLPEMLWQELFCCFRNYFFS